MSVEAMAIVLHHSKAKLGTKLILLGIANHDGDGGAWPSIETLARYANCTIRYAREQIRELEELGELAVELQAGGTREMDNRRRPNRYRVLVACPPECDRTAQHRVSEQPGTMVPPTASPQVSLGGTIVPDPSLGGTIVPSGGNHSSVRAEPGFRQTILEPPSNRGGGRRASSAPDPGNDPPPKFCKDHPTGTPQPCRACAAAARGHEKWRHDQERDRATREHDQLHAAMREAARTAAPPPLDLLRAAVRRHQDTPMADSA